MSGTLVIHKGRTNVITVGLGMDVSEDTFTSEIRVDPDQSSMLIATWEVGFATDGTDGELVLTLNSTATSQITQSRGYTDLKRVTNGEPVPVYDRPLEVEFRGTVTE